MKLVFGWVMFFATSVFFSSLNGCYGNLEDEVIEECKGEVIHMLEVVLQRMMGLGDRQVVFDNDELYLFENVDRNEEPCLDETEGIPHSQASSLVRRKIDEFMLWLLGYSSEVDRR